MQPELSTCSNAPTLMAPNARDAKCTTLTAPAMACVSPPRDISLYSTRMKPQGRQATYVEPIQKRSGFSGDAHDLQRHDEADAQGDNRSDDGKVGCILGCIVAHNPKRLDRIRHYKESDADSKYKRACNKPGLIQRCCPNRGPVQWVA